MNYLILVNKKNKVSKDYIPSGLKRVKVKTGGDKKIYLEKRCYKNVKKLLKVVNKRFKKDNIFVVIDSGYRTYYYQEGLVEKLKQEKQDDYNKTLANPGESEHQTGLAVDIGFYKNGVYDANFDVLEYENVFKFIHKICYQYGFILRYPLGKEDLTGYSYEPWHFRYVSMHAKEIYYSDKTLEEYLNSN